MVQARTILSFQRDVIDTCQNFKCAYSFLNTSAFGNATLQTFWAHKNVCIRQFSGEIGCIYSIDKKEFYTRFKNHLHMCVWLYTHVYTRAHIETKRRYLSPQSWSPGICRMPIFLDGAGNGVPGFIVAARTLHRCIISQPPFTSVFLVTLRCQRQHKWAERRSLNKVWLTPIIRDPGSRNSLQQLKRMSYS